MMWLTGRVHVSHLGVDPIDKLHHNISHIFTIARLNGVNGDNVRVFPVDAKRMQLSEEVPDSISCIG